MGKAVKLSLGLALGLVLTTAAFAQNLLLNPGFEAWSGGAGGPPDNWYLATGSITAAQEAVIIHGGTYSCNLTWTSTSNQDFAQDVNVTPGQAYVFSFWGYDNDAAGRIRVNVRWYDSTSTFISGYYGGYTSDGTDWELLTSGEQTAPANAMYAQCLIRCYDVSTY